MSWSDLLDLVITVLVVWMGLGIVVGLWAERRGRKFREESSPEG